MQRRYYIDYLRACGCVAVVALHVIANRLDNIAPTEANYLSLSGLLILCRWAVPVFVMASGCNLLGRNNEFHLVKKHSTKILILVFFWGFAYLFADSLINLLTGYPIDTASLSPANLFQGYAYPLWFCFMIVGLYLLIPVLNPIIKDQKRCEYLIGICIFSAIILPMLNKASGICSLFGTIVDRLQFPSFGIYVCYFVLGYYLEHYADFSSMQRKLLYAAAIASVFAMISYSFINAICFQAHTTIATPEYPTAVIFSVGVFTFFKYHFNQGRFYQFFAALANCSLGIYVMHNYLIVRLGRKGIHSVMFHPLLAVPLVTIIVVSVCFTISWLLKKIPVIGKWIV